MSTAPEIQRFIQDVSTREYFLAASLGLIPGVEADVKFGHVPDAANGVRTDIWELGGTVPVYIFPNAAGESLEVVSANAGDTGSFTVIGEDENGEAKTEIISLNGTTPVPLTGLWTTINSAFNSNGVDLLGRVSARGDGSTTTNVFAVVDPDDQQTSQAVYKVPSGKLAVIKNFSTAANKGTGVTTSVVFGLRVRNPGGVFRTQIRYGLITAATSNISSDLVVPVFAPPGAQIKVSATPTAGPVDLSAEFSMILIDEGLVPAGLIASL